LNLEEEPLQPCSGVENVILLARMLDPVVVDIKLPISRADLSYDRDHRRLKFTPFLVTIVG